ncbi:MAG TPA: YihA family ribosome biogenesis GTP-binding protein [Bacteroidales bacterium]|nr:YihA family ribosome biogenesis GTP-binding protein [Bacteroidales bacterium]
MKILSAEFVKSSTSVSQCPTPDKPEFAFIGRSNVGKSSLINMLTGKKGLAKTSGTPGKTRLINHFIINNQWYLVDLPGYGYARISKKARDEWEKMIKDYLRIRKSLMCIFLLVDVRHAPQASDLEMMDWIAEQAKPFLIVFTKADKLTKRVLAENLQAYSGFLKKEWEIPPQTIVSSSNTGLGKDEVSDLISRQLQKLENFSAEFGLF